MPQVLKRTALKSCVPGVLTGTVRRVRVRARVGTRLCGLSVWFSENFSDNVKQ